MPSKRDKAKRWQFGLKELLVGVVGVCVLAWCARIVHRTEPDMPLIGWAWFVVVLFLPLASLILIVIGRGRVGVCLFLVWIAMLFAATMLLAAP